MSNIPSNITPTKRRAISPSNGPSPSPTRRRMSLNVPAAARLIKAGIGYDEKKSPRTRAPAAVQKDETKELTEDAKGRNEDAKGRKEDAKEVVEDVKEVEEYKKEDSAKEAEEGEIVEHK